MAAMCPDLLVHSKHIGDLLQLKCQPLQPTNQDNPPRNLQQADPGFTDPETKPLESSGSDNFLLVRTNSHMLHGTAIFTYMKTVKFKPFM